MTIMSSGLVMISGGCRSGKSSFALQYAAKRGRGGIFIATAPMLDAEMQDRVRRHREERCGLGWETCEAQLELAKALANCPQEAVVLIDCLTLWVNNIMYHWGGDDGMPGEDELAEKAAALVAAARSRLGLTIVVSNEVGMGVAPANDLARRFRDLAGRVNQVVAKHADAVFFMVSGLPVKVK